MKEYILSIQIGDTKLQALIQRRDVCRNSLMSKWTYLKENFYPHNNLIDELCSCGLVDDDRAESIKEKPRREQVYSTLRNIVRRIDGPKMFSKLVSILEKESSFIAEKLEETLHQSGLSDAAGAKNCFCRNPCVVEDMAFRDKLHQLFYFYKDDIAREFYPTDVDTFMDKLVFDVDDHEIICEAGNVENKKAWSFYQKIADTKYIQKGSFDCLIFCLRNNEKLKKSRQILADMLFSQIIPEQVKNRTAIASRTTDAVIYPENTSKFTEGELKLTVDDISKDRLEHEIFKVVESSEYLDKEIDGLKLKVKDTKRSSVVVHLKSNGENVKLIVEKGILKGNLSSFIRNLLDDENIKMHMIRGHKYKISVSLHSKNEQKLFSGVRGSHKMRIIKANRELLEEEYDPLPLLKSVFEENVKKYKSVAVLSPQYVTAVFQQFKEISKVPERRKRVKQFMDIAEYMFDADTLWGLIEDTANAFSVKKLRDDLHDVNSGKENIKLSVACSEEGLVFKGRYEVWITEEDVKSPLQSMILETNRKQDALFESMHLETRREKEEDQKHLKDLKTSLESVNLETRQKRDETSKYHPAFLMKKLTKDETIIYRSPSLEELWSEDEVIQYPWLFLFEMREEDRNNDVKLWIKIRMETLSRLDELKDELLKANKKNKRATIARSLTFGLALVGGALFSVYTGGLSMAGSTLITEVFTTGAASIILLIKEYVKGGVLRRTQLGIYEDQTATHHFKIKVLRLVKVNIPFVDNLSLRADNLRFADNLRKIKLKGIEDLAKVPLEQLISRFGDTESSSLLTAVDKISEFKVILEQELQEVERILGPHLF